MSAPTDAPTDDSQNEVTDEQAEALLAEAVASPEPQAGQKPQGGGLPDDPDALRAEIAKLRKENASARTSAKQKAADEARNELAQQIGKALGLVADEQPVDPAQLTEQLSQSQAAALGAQRELAVFQAAIDAKADARALLDSRSFMQSIAEINPTDGVAIAAAIGDAMTNNPRLAAMRAPAPNPAQGSSGGGTPSQAEQAQAATARGDWKTAAALKADQLLALRAQQG